MVPVTGSVLGGRLSTETDAEMRARLVESLTQSFPGSALSRALNACKDEPEDPDDECDPLSLSCFAEIRLDKIKLEEDSDDDLTSLEWLQDQDLLKNIRPDEGSMSPEDQEEKLVPFGQPHPHNIPYNPQKHINSKPPYSFSCLIFMAIEESPDKRLPVKDIYNWIVTHFPYFQHAPTGWKNSVRHNLSLNKCFRKVDKDRGSSIGKGSLWMVDPDFRPNLLQALRRTPYAPYHQMQMLAQPQLSTNYSLLPGLKPAHAAGMNFNTPSPHLFPFLSKRIAQANGGIKVEDDFDARGRSQTCGSDGERSRSPSPPEFGSAREKEQIQQRRAKIREEWRRKHPGPATLYALPHPDHSYVITDLSRVPGYEPSSPASSVDEQFDFGRGLSDVSDDCDDSGVERPPETVEAEPETPEPSEDEAPADPNVRTSRRLKEKKRRKVKDPRDAMYVMLPLKKRRRASKDPAAGGDAAGKRKVRSQSAGDAPARPAAQARRRKVARGLKVTRPLKKTTKRPLYKQVDNTRRLRELRARLGEREREERPLTAEDEDLATGAEALLNLARLAAPLKPADTVNNNDNNSTEPGQRAAGDEEREAGDREREEPADKDQEQSDT